MCSINHDLQIVFIHIPKTAGTYMADILHKYYGFKNYYITRPDHERFCLMRDNSIKSHENKIHGTLIYYKTSSYCNKIMNMTPEKWDSYYKFCFVRNPYDKIISGWNYVNGGKFPLNYYLTKPFQKNCWDYWHVLMPQVRHIINEKGKIGIDFIGKFEDLEEDFTKVLSKFNLERRHKPFKKNSRKHDKYYKYYNQGLLTKVNHILREDFEAFSDLYKKYDNYPEFILASSQENHELLIASNIKSSLIDENGSEEVLSSSS